VSGCLRIPAAALLALALCSAPAIAQKNYDPGASDTEIRIGNIMPYTGVFSEYGAIGRAEAAHFAMINDRGGVNGRRITFVSVDDGSKSANAVELARKLVETDQVLLLAGNWGTAPNVAMRAYLNEKKVPQLFVSSSSATFDDPSRFPWTMGFHASSRTEGAAYASYVLRTKPDARIALLYANTDEGHEWRPGLHDGLADKASNMIVKEATFDYNDPRTIDPQIAALKASGADVFMNLATGRFATRAISRAYDEGWHPLQFIPNGSLSIEAFLDPAGLQRAVGIISNARSKG